MAKRLVFLLLIFFSSVSFSQTVYVYNITTKDVVVNDQSEKIRPIASITKLMTTAVIIDSGLRLETEVPAKGIYFFRNFASREDLLKLTMVKSDNYAAEALANSYPGGRETFLKEMNRTAKFLGMDDTYFDDPTGLSSKNTSSAKDLAKLLIYAYNNEKIKSLSSISHYSIEIKEKKKTKAYGVNNTNHTLMEIYNEIKISKTGTTNAAGKCLALFVTKNDEKYAIVLLGFKDRRSLELKAKEIFQQYINYGV